MKGAIPDEVKEADSRILLDERTALMSATCHEWEVEGLSPLGVEVQGWQPERAKSEYLSRFAALTTERTPYA